MIAQVVILGSPLSPLRCRNVSTRVLVELLCILNPLDTTSLPSGLRVLVPL